MRAPTIGAEAQLHELLEALRADVAAEVAALVDGDMCVAVDGDGAALGCVAGQRVDPDQLAGAVSVPVPGTTASVVCATLGSDLDLSTRPRALAAATAERCRGLLGGLALALTPADDAALVHRVLDDELFLTVFQPIIDVRTHAVVASEALTRFPAEPVRSSELWFAAAAQVGLGPALEVAALRQALRMRPPLDLTVNVTVGAATSRRFLEAIDHMDEPERLIVELHGSTDADRLARLLTPMRRRGVRIAVEELGDGLLNVERLMTLAPEFVKLHASVTARVNGGATGEVIDTVVRLAHHAGARVVAQQVERDAQLAAFADLGVDWCEGFLVGRPSHRLRDGS